jgi:ribokinase
MENGKKHLDFLAIGDTVVDAFIELEDARVTCDVNDANCTISMRFGDKIPYKSLEEIAGVGNSPNAAVAAARLGLTTGILTNVGDDIRGTECMNVFAHEGIATDASMRHAGIPTNYHFVLSYEAERTILVHHEHYPYALPKAMPSVGWVYLSSLGSGTESYHDEIIEWLEANPETKLAFQPGSFQMKMGTEQLKRIYARTELFFCNVEEAQRILKMPDADDAVLAKSMHELGPKMVVITNGPKGLLFSNGTDMYRLPMFPDPKPPVERTGAGDATSSTITAYIALGYDPIEAIMRGPINSMNVVQYVGAQKGLLLRERLEEILANKPESYRADRLVEGDATE